MQPQVWINANRRQQAHREADQGDPGQGRGSQDRGMPWSHAGNIWSSANPQKIIKIQSSAQQSQQATAAA